MQHLLLEIETNLLADLILAIDQQLEGICRKSLEVEDADTFGYFDSAEHVTGLGFVTGQTYMATVYGHLRIEKQKALSAGLCCSGGETKAQIINYAANYWKHSNGWALVRIIHDSSSRNR